MRNQKTYFSSSKGVKLCTKTQSKEVVKKFFTIKLNNIPKRFSRYSYNIYSHWVINSSKPIKIHSLKEKREYEKNKNLGVELNNFFNEIFNLEGNNFSLDLDVV